MSLLKLLAANVLPPPLLFWVKKRYYARTVQTFWEADVEPIKYLVNVADFVVDIGANVGWYTKILSTLVGEHGRVYSIEPIPETFRLLSSLIKKLGLRNVEPLNCAISEEDGMAVMEIPLHDYGGTNFYQARIVGNHKLGDSLRQYKVPLRSIDSLFLDPPKDITFIKCDVEGHDLSVIKGASRFLLNSKPAWLIEVSGNPDNDGSPANELFAILKKNGYSAYLFDGQNLRKRIPGHWSVNYFFLQPSHISQLAHLTSFEDTMKPSPPCSSC